MRRSRFEGEIREILDRLFGTCYPYENASKEIMELFDLHEQQELNESLLEKMWEEKGYEVKYDPVSKQIVRAEGKE